MSLRQLLPISRAFKPIQDRTGRYRSTDPGVLPDFASPSAPSTANATSHPAAAEESARRRTVPPQTPTPAMTRTSPFSAPKTSTASLADEARRAAASPHPTLPAVEIPGGPGRARASMVVAPSSAATLPASTPVTVPASAPRGRRLPEWLEQLLVTVLRPGNRRRGTRPVQTEWSFESLKVARNDLSTADVEVVVAPPPKPPSPLSPGCRTRLLRLWWTEGAHRVRKLGGLLF